MDIEGVKLMNTRDFRRRQAQEIELANAIAHHEFYLVYQPQVDLDTGALLAIEALIRWQHPQKGTILPRDFIPLAEESGLLVFLGEWVLDAVCKQIVQWRKNGFPAVRVAINVSSQQLQQGNFAHKSEGILAHHGVSPQCLDIEIREHVIANHPDVLSMMKQLKAIGVGVVLDRFGMNHYSSFYLEQIHIDRVKIDKMFVQNIAKNHSVDALIEAIMTMARNVDCKVVAEGVENREQINFLKTQHCQEAQGFLFSKPLPAGLVEQFFVV